MEFAGSLDDNLTQWANGSKVRDDFRKLKDLVCLEQFYETFPENIRWWVRNRQEGSSVEKAAQLADEFVAIRSFRQPKAAQGFRNGYQG